MEYYLCRAMEVCRISSDSLFLLQEKENILGRCLYPNEMQKMINLCSIKENYGIPFENEQSQATHISRLSLDMRKNGLIPENGNLSVLDVEKVHAFDDKVVKSNSLMQIDISFHGVNIYKRKTDEL